MSAAPAVVLAVTAAVLLLPGAARVHVPTLSLGPLLLALLGAGVGLALLLLSGRRLVLVLVGLAVVAGVAHHVVRGRRRAARRDRATRVMLACDGLAADLAAGQTPVRALHRAVEAWPDLEVAARAADLGADVSQALRTLATLPGAEQVRMVAAAWQVAHRSGSGLAAALSRCSRALRHEQALHRLVDTELASARATARMMAVLPALVLLLGRGIGGDPIGFLLDSPWGLGCLCAGLGLAFLGTLWLDRIAEAVQP